MQTHANQLGLLAIWKLLKFTNMYNLIRYYNKQTRQPTRSIGTAHIYTSVAASKINR